MASAAGIIDFMEESIDELAEWMADQVEMVTDAIAPDGRPFGMEHLSEEEQIEKYLAEGLHDNTEACLNWIRTRVQGAQQRLLERGVPQEAIASYHLYDLYQKAALAMSAKYERLIREREEKRSVTPEPITAFDPMMGVDDGGTDYPTTT